ncbi:MAG: CDP-alcohol phosphatidyltransferase family protein [Gemmatimonadales bacterium]
MNVIPQRVKDGFVRLLEPFAHALIRAGVHPNVITTCGTALVVAAGVAFGSGKIRLGGLLLLVSGLFDILDGQVARLGGMSSTFGAFYDSTLDRIGESAVFAGLAIHFLPGGVAPATPTVAVAVALTALTASLLVSYTRARAEGLGLECQVGIAARAERILLLGVPCLFGPSGTILFWIVVVLALAAVVTVVQRVAHVARITRSAEGRSERPRRPHAPLVQRETLPGVAAIRRKGP